jgi:beta-galactosidase
LRQPRIGWQIDNEYNRVCYCERCQRHFQQYLANKYGSIEALNERWSTRYWSQTYSDWQQIPLPNNWLELAPRLHNPALMLELLDGQLSLFQRTDRCARAPAAWITQFMGWHDGYDHYDIAADLDLAAWDWYIPDGYHDFLSSGAAHDLTRGFKRRNFWLIETQPGATSFGAVNNNLRKGEARAMAWHAVAHGADAVLYWQWRAAYGGQEQYFSTLIDQSGAPRPFYAEAQQLGREQLRGEGCQHQPPSFIRLRRPAVGRLRVSRIITSLTRGALAAPLLSSGGAQHSHVIRRMKAG